MQEPGWYSDPHDGGQLRWWDGSQWSDAQRPDPSGTRPPGWYDDERHPGVQRFWDGSRWTDRTYGAVASPTPAAPPPSLPFAPDQTALSPQPAAPLPKRGVGPALVVVLALVAGLLAAGVTFLLVRDQSGDDVATAAADDEASSEGDGDSTSAAESDRSASDQATPPSSSASASPTSRPGPTLAPAPPSAAPGVDGWIAVLASVPVSEGQPAADARLAELRVVAPGAQIVLSDDYASLNPGYRVIYVPGFASESAVHTFCGNTGLAVPSQCYGRVLSQDPADRELGGG